MRGWLGAGCALALACFCLSTRALPAQDAAAPKTAPSKSGSSTAGAKPKSTKAKSTGSKSASPSSGTHAKTVAKSHPASHHSAASHPKSNTAIAARTSKTKYANSKNGKGKKTARGQQKIEPERAEAIQQALIREHYLSSDAAGTWNQASEDAMRRYQADHGWQSKTVPDSRALISLGLGPSHDHLLNPESAMTTEPESPHSASLIPASHSVNAGSQSETDPPAAAAPATTPAHDTSNPQ